MENLKNRVLPAIALVLAAVLSFFVLSGLFTDPARHTESITMLDEKKATVMELTAATAVASAAITLMPGDTATPIAEKMADLSGYFLIVLCAIYLEKYLLTLTGYAAFQFLFPAACLLYLVYLFYRREGLRVLANRFIVFGLAIVMVIPISLRISGLIESTYQVSIDATLQAAQQVPDQVEDTTQEAEKKGFLSGLKDQVTDKVAELSHKVGDTVNRLVEALAVMIVTCCLIPILVLMFFAWIVKATFAIELPSLRGSRRLLSAGSRTTETL